MAPTSPELPPPEPRREVLALQCPECSEPRTFEVVHRHVRLISDGDPEELTYVICTKCSASVLLRRDYDYGDEGFESSRYIREFPVETRRLTFGVPRHVRHSYDEAVQCEQARAWTAVAVLVGRALEAICKDFDASSRTIHDGLAKMYDAGAISQELREWGNGLRVVRNEGAHSGERVAARDAQYSLDFLQALIEILFDLRVRFAEWQQDRAARAAAGRNPAPDSRAEP